jgi:hypothetical protein
MSRKHYYDWDIRKAKEVKKMTENLIWLKDNSKIFIDQNITIKLKDSLLQRGYKQVCNVYDLGYKGANDGKLLKLIQINKLILATEDYHFHRMASKYNQGMSIYFEKKRGWQEYRLSREIEQWLLRHCKEIKGYYS